MLKVSNVTKTYGKGENAFSAIKNIDIDIEQGESVAIVGKSGSGKSTLLHTMIGLDSPTSGDVYFKDKSIFKIDTDSWRGNNVGIVFQQFFLQNNESVISNVVLPLKIRGIKRKNRENRALKAIEAVGLADKAKNKAKDLSGGQKQRVAIARALVTNPKILVTDEPTGNLDSENGKVVEDLLFKLNKTTNTTLVIVTHDIDLAKRCQRIINLKDGQVVSVKQKTQKAAQL